VVIAYFLDRGISEFRAHSLFKRGAVRMLRRQGVALAAIRFECDAGRSIEEAVQGSFRLASQGADVRLFPILPTSRFLSILAV
jgi:hypothetical protein